MEEAGGARLLDGKPAARNGSTVTIHSRSHIGERCIARARATARVPRRILKTNPTDDLFRSLRAARRRVRAQLFLHRFVSIALCGAFALVALAAAQRWLLRSVPADPVWWIVTPSLAAVLALLMALLRRIELRDIAGLVDRLGGTHDRSLTALAFAESAAPFQQLAASESCAFLSKKSFARLIPIKLPDATPYLLVPVIALALLHWESRLAADARQLAAEAAQAKARPTAQRLERLAKQIEKSLDPAKDGELKKLAEQLKKSAQQLRTQDNGADEAEKAAKRELSALEQMLQQMQTTPASASPEEMKRLAEALAKSDATKPAAEAMRAGDMAQAAREIEDAAKQPTKDEAEKILRDALERLAHQRELSEAMQQLAKQAQQGEGGSSNEALQKLAKLLRDMARQQGSSGQPTKQPSAQMLKNLLAALENMKAGDQQESDSDPKSTGDGSGRLTIQSFAKPNLDGSPQPDESQIPVGQPGSERDRGTTKTPFGKQSGESADKGSDAPLKGRLSEGESLSQLLPTAGDSSKSSRRYKEIFDAMAPAAEDAVGQENIPLGSRILIKRYFESIRPQE